MGSLQSNRILKSIQKFDYGTIEPFQLKYGYENEESYKVLL